MKTQTAAAKTGSSVRTAGKVDEQILRVGFATIGISSCVIGIWALISLLGGMAASGGPLALIADWLKAILG
ncbi:MAG: hypothetical protein ACD_75C01463G0003 [uncultured bacterium]|nr:MAG: hypothetical protein ACD_75C01463G0003 [uncultured bacterium]OGR18347.1 MAG: hypothetical protein A2X81_14545 [Desulfobacterales bacterium GWB2_56_26]HBG19655.1 hypothetical protein [Desulfobulbaceae bacterium]